MILPPHYPPRRSASPIYGQTPLRNQPRAPLIPGQSNPMRCAGPDQKQRPWGFHTHKGGTRENWLTLGRTLLAWDVNDQCDSENLSESGIWQKRLFPPLTSRENPTGRPGPGLSFWRISRSISCTPPAERDTTVPTLLLLGRNPKQFPSTLI